MAESGSNRQELSILVLEDYPPDAELMIRQLARDGIACNWILADSEKKFLDGLSQFQPDLVLSDYSLPSFSGLEALGIMRNRFPSIPLIIVTGSISEDAAVKCMKEGAADYVIKENLSRLTTAVMRALEKKKMDEERACVEHDLKLKNAAVESAVDPIVLADLKGSLTYANAAFVHQWGYENKEEVLGRSVFEFFMNELETKKAADAVRNVGSWRGELCARRKNHEPFPATASLGLVLCENSEPLAIMGGFVDITEHRKLEAQLRQSHKMEALGTLAGGIAHDFNNILAAIIGYTEMAMEDLSPDSARFSNLEQVFMAARRATDLVRQILTFSRASETKRHPAYLQPILKETLKLLESSIPSDIRVKKKIDSNCERVAVDLTQFHQTVMNLCVNSIYAMRNQGGELTIKLEQRTQDGSYLELSPGQYVCLSVADTGIGMSEKVKARIFEPFFTTKPREEGTGLGLSTIHGIVTSSGGAVHVESEEGVGTCFEVFFPVVSQTEASETIPAPSVPLTQPSTSCRILVIDDEYAITQVYKFALERLGVDVDVYVEPTKAVAAFKSAPKQYSLVLTDWAMPEKSGLDVVSEIRAMSCDVPILISSGIADKLDKETLYRIGVNEIIPKPVGNELLRTTVQKYL